MEDWAVLALVGIAVTVALAFAAVRDAIRDWRNKELDQLLDVVTLVVEGGASVTDLRRAYWKYHKVARYAIEEPASGDGPVGIPAPKYVPQPPRDISAPVGTPIYAERQGIVVDPLPPRPYTPEPKVPGRQWPYYGGTKPEHDDTVLDAEVVTVTVTQGGEADMPLLEDVITAPPPKTQGWVHSRTMVHRDWCKRLRGPGTPMMVWSEEAAEKWAQGAEPVLAGCSICKPFQRPYPAVTS